MIRVFMVNLLEGWFGWSRHLSALDGLSAECVPGALSSPINRRKSLKMKGFILDSLSSEGGRGGKRHNVQ
jgi:hypothetical protein